MKRHLAVGLSVFIFVLPLSAHAATHYVSMGGTANWQSCTKRAAPCPYLEANKYAVAGDVVTYINDGGDFNGGWFIQPANSGTDGSPITFEGEGNTTVVIRSSAYGADLRNRSYITIQNLTFYNTGGNDWISLRNETAGWSSAHIIIQNCIFNAGVNTWGGIYISYDNSYISILNNTFYGGISSAAGISDVVYLVSAIRWMCAQMAKPERPIRHAIR